MPDDTARATREKVILALIPVASRHEMRNPQQIVDIATPLCKYIDQLEESGKPQESSTASGTTSDKRSPKSK